jgi:hypothetical protein
MMKNIIELTFKFKRAVLFLLATMVILVVFQNCSDIKVTQLPIIAPPQPAPVVAASKPEGSICAPQGAVFGAPVRITIILDMSMSNLGSVNSSVDTNNIATWRIDTDDGPTDLAGARFTQIRNFITNCGGSENVKYSIIGFSNVAKFARGQSCISPFESQVEALRTVDGFKNFQNIDLSRAGGIISNAYESPYHLGNETNYLQAINCLETKIENDLALLSSESPNYYTFFLTDGQPTDSDPNLLNTLRSKLSNIMTRVSTEATAFHFQGIYYTSVGARNGPPQQGAALNILTDMTKVTEGPTGAAINIQDLTTTQNELCSRLQPESTVDYNLKSMYAVNVSAKMSGNTLMSDTDADGVSDQVELDLGWDPKNSRSTGVFDGLCYLSTKNKAQCESIVNSLTCVRTSTSMGFNDCDRKFAQRHFGRVIGSPDIDKDSLPNFIEVIRHTSMSRADALENPAVDGVNNFEKVSRGMDVLSSLDTWPIDPRKLVDLNFTANAETCANNLKKMSYSIEQIPFVDIEKFEDNSDDTVLNFSHEKDENVVLVFTIWQSSGGINLPNRLYIQKWNVPKAGAARSEEPKFIGEF